MSPSAAGTERAAGPSGGPGHGRAVVLISHSYVDEDPRVRRQVEALDAAGWAVDVIGLRRPGEPATGRLGGARLRRLDVQRHQGATAGTYLLEYGAFFVRATLRLAVDHRRRHYALVQVATLPDWLVFAALPLRLLGVAVVIDLHEAMPAFFASRFPGLARGPARAVLELAERLSIAAATHAIAANEALGERLIGLGVPRQRLTVIPNVPSLARFDRGRHPRRPFMADGTLRLVYAGAVTPTYDLGVALEAMAAIRAARPELAVALDVYGRGDATEALVVRAAELGLDGTVRFHGRIPIEAVPAAVGSADVGIAPVSASAFTQLSFSTKLLEYGAMGLPVVAARLPLAERLL
ncbi:MAG TPA: glycosyltransferase, partial [Candidatus Limnocylindrales bacterium]|nr:glycosyltransferase [Candidatus Limnocylindrales bacterium]